MAFARHYGLTVATCLPADPAAKGGSEATVRIAKAGLVPTPANLLPSYSSFADLDQACGSFCAEVNARPHRATRRAPADMPAGELGRLHPVPVVPFTAALGVTRKAGGLSLVSFGGGRYSVPHQLAGQPVWARRHGDDAVIVHAGQDGPAEAARHRVTSPGSPSVCDAHYPPPPAGPAARVPRARTQAEAEFLAIGDGAGLWLAEAAAAGASRVRAKMAKAVQLSRLHPAADVDRALGQAAAAGRFGDSDLDTILAHQAAAADGTPAQASEDRTLAQGTGQWAGSGGSEVTR